MINKIRNLFNKFKKNESNIDEDFDLEIDADSSDNFDETGEFDLPPMPNDDEFTSEFDEDYIDLDEGKLSFKDKFNLLVDETKTKLASLSFKKPKKMQVKPSSDSKDSQQSPISSLSSKISGSKINKLSLSNIHNDFFNSIHRQSYHRVFQVIAILLFTFTAGKSIGIILSGSKDYKELPKNISLDLDKQNLLKNAHITQIKKAKLFKTEAKKVEAIDKPKKVESNLACTKADGKSRLPIKLINTIVLQDSVKSIASVQVRSENLLQQLRIGEKINDMAKIERIDREKLIIKNLKSGTCESIESVEQTDYAPIAVMSPKKSKAFKKKKTIKGIQNDGNNFVIEKSFLKSKMANISDILTQARGIQINNPDGTISFKIVDVQPGGVFAYLGIENGDIITEINNKPIQDLNAVMSLFGKLNGDIDKLGLNLKRAGVDTPQNYKFK